jgi:hypothetical protein
MPLEEDKTSYNVWLTTETLWERFSTLSHVAMLEGKEKEHSVKRSE